MNPAEVDIKKGDRVLVQIYDKYGTLLGTRQATVIAQTRIDVYFEDDIFVLVRYPEEEGQCQGYGCVPLKQVRKVDGGTERK